MRASLVFVLVLALLWGCASKKVQPRGIENGNHSPAADVEADPQDWEGFYAAVLNEEDELVEQFLARGFDLDLHQENLAEYLYFEIYHSIQGFESRYLEGPLDPETQAYYAGLEQDLIALCQRLKDLGLKPGNTEDLVSAAVFREFPALVEWLNQEF